MASMNTLEDFIQVLRENPEFRATVRRELLTEELLSVPTRLTTLEQGIAALLEHAEVTNRRLDQVDKRLDQVDKRLDNLEVDIKEVKMDINGLGDSYRREVRAQSSFRGAYAQQAANSDDLDIAVLFARRHGLDEDRIQTWHLPRRTLDIWVDTYIEALRALGLEPGALRAFRRPDIVAEVKDLAADQDAAPSYYITVEASYTVEKKDIVRATDNAKIVREITGLAVYPVVAGVELDDQMTTDTQRMIDDDLERFIEVKDADVAFWYRLDSADLRPPEPPSIFDARHAILGRSLSISVGDSKWLCSLSTP
ncbi:MAG: hypothetical protein J4G14_10125 [Dehalococcoidia bacterium]|nr:hypothetical protein [Dehalococcoidia bacterium]